jgi:hypothetical protein
MVSTEPLNLFIRKCASNLRGILERETGLEPATLSLEG